MSLTVQGAVFRKRLRLRLNQLDRGPNWLAEQLGRHPTTVAAWLAGRNVPPVSELERIGLVLHRKPSWFLTDLEDVEENELRRMVSA